MKQQLSDYEILLDQETIGLSIPFENLERREE